MHILKKPLLFLVLVTLFSFTSFDESGKQNIEIVFCMDLSSSTNGLLSDVRDNLWHLVNNARERYPESALKIGFVAFARPSFGGENNFVKIISDISDDFDQSSYNLYLLNSNTEKGDQCDGSAIYTSLKELHWSNNPATKKMIFIFGNSSVKMCGYDYRKACDIAAKENIVIHSVYCANGSYIQKYFPMWNEIAELTGGNFNTYTVTRRSPLKTISRTIKNMIEWNDNLNDTYMPFNKESKLHYDFMIAADDNSKKMNEQIFYERCNYKFSQKFAEQCSRWDLVTRLQNSTLDFKTINKNYLPEEYQKGSQSDLIEILKIKAERRRFLQGKMQETLTAFKNLNAGFSPLDTILYEGINKETALSFNKGECK